MSETAARARAERAQLEASDPRVSAFVAASAGSGKTKLLTDRLLRLMLSGADPARIQCLTFTKTGAAEMALRLRQTLGEWVRLDDAALDAELARLDVPRSVETRREARALFARVLDLPGGMRIGTIHAFCQSLLRRFPLEAAISPHFRLADDLDAKDALARSQEATLEDADTPEAALTLIATLTTLDGFSRLVSALKPRARDVEAAAGLGAGLRAAYRGALGVSADSEAALIAGAVAADRRALRDAAGIVAREGSPGCRNKAFAILGFIGDPRADRWDEWRGLFLKKDGEAQAASGFVNKNLDKTDPDLAAAFLAEAERILAVEDQCRASRLADTSAALVRLAAPVLSRYRARKDASGLLDYDDLIRVTSRLLVDPGAAWVLYKLDGGLDHLLLDEVQDTAPDQWRIAHALTAEFFAGEGAGRAARTVFAVGDRKQSIFSFQGADAAAFDASRDEMARRVTDGGGVWRDVAMDVSFRSTAPVLALADAVFADPDAAQGVGCGISHQADRAGFAGRVELWPLAPVQPADDPAPWAVPEGNTGAALAPQRLAERLAEWIRRQTDGSVMLESQGRPLAPGDVLVLLRRRGSFDRSLLRELKRRGVPVAGLDRLVLTDQPAVADLLSLCDVLLLPDDDLSLACVLKSPLGFCDEDALMALAAPAREGSLWRELQRRAGERADWTAAHGMIAGLLRRVDFATPHALLSEALVAQGGRARLFARLGAEAAEPLDELLNAALADQASHPPSLQGFVCRLRQSGAEVKREAEGAGGAVRIMTVHGAKGLQAPLVILPDTTFKPSGKDRVQWTRTGGMELPLWTPHATVACEASDSVREAARRRQAEEENRLLYVALTRAEDRLLVCGWQTKKPSPGCWHALVSRGFERLPAERGPFADWEGETLSHASRQVAAPKRKEAAEPAPSDPLPAWAGRAPDWTAAPLDAEPPLPVHLAPSRPENAALGPVPPAASPLSGRDAGERFLRGRLVHALLQHLPDLPRADRAEAARRWLARPAHAVPDGEGLADEVLAILDHPELAELFGPGSRAEAPLTGVIGGSVVGGLVDRLAVLDGRVLVADYKTNREPPACVAETPVMYLRQMAAYRAVLRAVHPGREVRCALVWTRAARVDALPCALLDAHAPA